MSEKVDQMLRQLQDEHDEEIADGIATTVLPQMSGTELLQMLIDAKADDEQVILQIGERSMRIEPITYGRDQQGNLDLAFVLQFHTNFR